MEENQDRLLPIANVGRIMRQVLPQNAKISKAPKERMQEYATEFISFVTSEASDKCRKDNRKTINGDEKCTALNHLGFDNLGESTTRRYLYKFREFEREKLLNQLHHEEATNLGVLPVLTHPILEIIARKWRMRKLETQGKARTTNLSTLGFIFNKEVRTLQWPWALSSKSCVVLLGGATRLYYSINPTNVWRWVRHA